MSGSFPSSNRLLDSAAPACWCDRLTGLCCATTAWETREAMAASRPTADNMRSRTAREAGGEILDVHEFELAYAHLHVPEMA